MTETAKKPMSWAAVAAPTAAPPAKTAPAPKGGVPVVGNARPGKVEETEAEETEAEQDTEPDSTRLTSEDTALGIGKMAKSGLPKEAGPVWAAIDKGGPYEFPEKDGTTYNNFEGFYPARPRGYYREYTVKTPGAKNRGKRRLVVGQAWDTYYSANHYKNPKKVIG